MGVCVTPYGASERAGEEASDEDGVAEEGGAVGAGEGEDEDEACEEGKVGDDDVTSDDEAGIAAGESDSVLVEMSGAIARAVDWADVEGAELAVASGPASPVADGDAADGDVSEGKVVWGMCSSRS